MWKKSGNSDNLILPLIPSKWLQQLAIGVYILTAISLLVLAWQHPWLVISLPAIWLHARYTVRSRIGLRSPSMIVHCQQISSVYWRLTTRAGVSLLVKKQGKAYRTPWLIILPFKNMLTARNLTLLIAHDALPEQQYLSLLARLWPD